MARVGRTPLMIPDKAKLEPHEGQVEVAGPIGKVVLSLPPGLAVKIEGNKALVALNSGMDPECGAALQNLTRTLLNNALHGVTQGFKRDLEIIGVGYRAQVASDKLVMTLGFSHPVEFKIPAGVKIAVDKQTLISISGPDKHQVGEVAAQIRRIRPPEAYKGTGLRYAGESIRRKAGKAAVVGAGASGAKK